MSSSTRARLELIVWLLIAGVFYGLTFRFSGTTGVTFEWGPAAWPRAALIIMAVVAVANYLTHRPVGAAASERQGSVRSRQAVINLIGLFAIPLVYVWLLPRIGFYIATLIFLPVYMRYLGERRWKFIAGVTLLLFALVNLVFTHIFFAGLPTGNWPGFYEVSSWFVTLIR